MPIFLRGALSHCADLSFSVLNESRKIVHSLSLKKMIVIGLLIFRGAHAETQTVLGFPSPNPQRNFDLPQCFPHQIKQILPIDVSSIPVEVSHIDLCTVKLKKGTSEYSDRIENAQTLRQSRWDWVQKNPQKYVNLLRKANITDSSITAMSSRKYPLGFKNEKQYKRYKIDLFKTLEQISNQFGIKNFRVVEQGSYVVGYSSSPVKGDRTVPNHIFNDNSDIDLRITADNINEYLINNKVDTNSKTYYPNLIEPDELSKVFPQLHDFSLRWTEKIKRNFQIIVTKIPGPEFEPNPWDHEIFS